MNTAQNLDKLMTKHPITVGYEDLIQKASEIMLEHRFRHLPVTDQLGEVIGILSDRDIQRAMETRRQGIEIEMVIAPHRKVKDFMSWPPHAVPDSTPLVDVVKFMVSEKISALLIHSANTGKVRGIITTEDVLKEFARTLETVPTPHFSQLQKQ
jgi:CBS domain-containing protein